MVLDKAYGGMRRALCAVLALAVALSCMMLPQAAMAADTGVTNAKVVLRKEADKESSALQTVPEGEEVDILGKSGDWYKVRYGNYTGYMMKKYVTQSPSAAAAAAASIKALGTAPGIMRIGDENSDVKKLQQALNILGYYDGKIDGIFWMIMGAFGTAASTATAPPKPSPSTRRTRDWRRTAMRAPRQ